MSLSFYLSAADVYHINQEVVGHEPLVIDQHLLRAAVARPYTRMFGQEAYPTLTDKASALLHALAHDHLFMDGNKRTARIAVERFAVKNEATLTWTNEEAYTLILEIAKGRYDVDDVAERLKPYFQMQDETE
jgi:death-on-curing protein